VKGLEAHRVWFTADQHFNHRSICELAHRPWGTMEAMHEGLIAAWNSKVALTDFIFVLGDFSLGSKRRAAEVMAELNGQKFLIRGNHDDSCHTLFEWWKHLYTVKVHDPTAPAADEHGLQRIVLCHYPLLVWERRHYGVWHLHGHSHGNLERLGGSMMMDVGVDATWNSAPVSYHEVRAFMQAQSSWPWSRPLDHHKGSKT
jgi:calcineurin-like phosphoesterase family protein